MLSVGPNEPLTGNLEVEQFSGKFPLIDGLCRST